jgi:hypothetical protein
MKMKKMNKKINYKPLINKIYEHYLGEIYPDELNEFFIDWAKQNNYPLPKMIKLLTNMAYNSEGDIIPIVQECEENIYYNDGCHRYCYLSKKDEGIHFEYIK